LSATETARIAAAADVDEPRLERIWRTRPGWVGFFTSVDHKQIGLRYIVTAFVFLGVGGVESLVMRLQLTQPGEHLVTPEQYNQLFSTHGVTMIFLYALPILTGFSNYLWPLVLGSRDMAFPRLNAFSYWSYVAAAIFLYAGFLQGVGPDAGWFNYVPLAGKTYDPGANIDFYALGMILLGVSTTVGAANFVVTFLRCRAPGMSIDVVPIMIWGTLSASAANLLAVPAVSLAFFLLWMDRQAGTHFFDVLAGGQPLLWQHLFWLFAHPWVYVIVLPAMGMVSQALPVYCRRPLVGYSAVALSTVATILLGFGVWVHHMFAVGLPSLAVSFFSGASIMITLPSAVAVFAWVATLWTGKPNVTTAFLYFASMIVLFTIGGVSGFMTASAPADWELTDTYFVVAHLHYVLLGINLFPVLGAAYHWFPKFTGRLLGERLGRWNFWLSFIGFNMAFLPMHLTGLWGMPRRVYTYPAGMGWGGLNLLITIGAFVLALGLLLFVINVVVSLKRGAVAPENPWDADSLEWTTASPPPEYNFRVLPTVASRNPLWESRLDEAGEARTVLDRGLVLDHGRESLAVSALEGEPDLILRMPDDSWAPVLLTLALSVLFVALLEASVAWSIVGALSIIAALLIWTWPTRRLAEVAQ
jgi:cytochrome c oxidase subunit I